MRLQVMAGLVVSLYAASAHADGDGAEPIGIRYKAPAECPDSFAFFREIASHTSRVRAARRGETARVLSVEVRGSGATFTGELAIEDPAGGKSSTREVHGASCEEIVEALGLVGALAVDPQASVETSAPAPTASAPPPPPPKPLPDDDPFAPPPAVTAPPAIAPPVADRAETAPTAARTPSAPRRMRFAVGSQLEGAFLADLVATPRFFVEGELQRTDGDMLSPSLRLGFARSFETTQGKTFGAATLQWTQATLDACPVRFSLAPALDLRPCAGLAAGVLDASASSVNQPRDRSRPWVSGSAGARVMWELMPNVGLEIESGAMVPFVRESFFFAPGLSIYTPPAIAFFGRGGVSVRFP